MSFIWNELIVNPFTNALLLLYDILNNDFFWALAVFTVLTRLAMLPLNLRQQRSMMKQQELQPQIQAIQKKYGNDQQKMMEEFRKIGYNPADTLVGCLPLIITMPIFLGLYRAIQFTLASTPIALYQLSQRAYDFIDLTPLLPVSNRFAWLNLAQPDPLFILPILVVGTMFLSQKLMTPKQTDAQKKAQDDNPAAAATRQMQYTMPLMFGLFSLQFPAGVSIYFIFSNIISILQGYIVQRERVKTQAELDQKRKTRQAVEVSEPEPDVSSSNGKAKSTTGGQSSSKKKRKQGKR